MAIGTVSLRNIFDGPSPPYVDAESVNLGGGAGADWTPTKAPQTRALMIGTGGTLKCDTAAGSIGVSLTVPAGEFKISVTKVYNTVDGSTGLANVTALY